MIRTVLAALLAATLAPLAFAQEAAATRRAVELRDAPGDRGRAIASLPAQAPVTRLPERQGPWVQVRTEAGATGWVHLFDVGPASSAGSSTTGNALRGVTGLFGGRSTQASTTAAGIRGLDAADLARSQPDTSAVARMEATRQSEADARSFAGRSGWRPATVQALPEPARSSSSSSSRPAGNPGQPESP